MKGRRKLAHQRVDTRSDDDLHFAVGELDVAADALWEALRRATAQRATRVCLTLEDVASVIDGIEAARTLEKRTSQTTIADAVGDAAVQRAVASGGPDV
jgi:hypothetical protein